ncbi:hypothetical protein [Polaribacter cellanae]|uniref:Uncharacterized protein n=1 Tax=Polaribacter cellanae TaxID=2818493 RepID=A0A975CLL3_9FLAO|nr:hypothetical protein [Polaribacter cellanae]QTE21559.1 hypothetical protein J3359_12090 [Polaribacter cellanae]
MELTKEQIQRVEHYLNVKNIKYIDVRFEVLDHIVSDIETTIEKNNLDFETAFYKVTDKWNTHLKETSSWFFGIAHSAPKIIIDKAKKLFKKWFFILPAVYFMISFFNYKLNIIFSKNIENVINLFFQITSVFCFVLYVIVLILISRSKEKTTYRFIFKTQNLNLLIGTMILLDFNFFNNDGSLSLSLIGLLFAFILSTFMCFHFYRKHKEAVKKYKIS